MCLVECGPRSSLVASAQGLNSSQGTRLSQPADWGHKTVVKATCFHDIREKTHESLCEILLNIRKAGYTREYRLKRGMNLTP